MGKNIAIDGPAGAGKSTIARTVASKLGFIYVDTGALYRSIGLYCLNNNIETTDKTGVERILPDISVQLKYLDGAQRVILNDNDVSEEIRKPECSMAASNVSAIPVVREFLFELQRKMARENDVIMDGRDIGTVVLPDANVKIKINDACATVDEECNENISANVRELNLKYDLEPNNYLKGSIGAVLGALVADKGAFELVHLYRTF